MKHTLKVGKKLECLIFVVFIITYIVITLFHEPWFDEAQAWQIARGPSLMNILFTIPHYEGHPPLWYLILAIPSRIGVPFELGLKTIGFIISTVSVGLLLFRSQLPRIARLLLPFSFFIFYQYGIIVRPYGLMLILLLLLGQNFSNRELHPWRITILMMLLCVTSAYGIVICGGIALGIVWELFQEKGVKGFFRDLLFDPRSASLLALLLLAIMLILNIMPREDTWVTSVDRENPFLLCLLCTFFTFPGDCLITDNIWFQTDTVLLQTSTLPPANLVAACILGMILLLLIISVGSKRDLKFFFLPYIFFCIFSAAVYVGAHHIGIALLIILFWMELEFRSEKRFEIGRQLLDKLTKTERERRLVLGTISLIGMICLLMPIYWTVSAAIRDIQLEYSYGRSAASFFKENQLDNRTILSAYGQNSSDIYREQIGVEDYINTYDNALPVPICAYLNHNIFLNLGNGLNEEAYMHYRIADYEKSKYDLAEWASAGIPEVLLGKPELEPIYGNETSIYDYSLVAVFKVNYIWKNQTSRGNVPVFIRNDLVEKSGLEPLKGLKYESVYFGIPTVTEKIRERYENGESMEEILKPYLDAMFGL